MIAFDLQCAEGHTFEGWFDDSKAYEDQIKRQLVSCPICNTNEVSKILSPVAIRKSASPMKTSVLQKDQLPETTEKLIAFVEKNFDNVGCDFAKEALKIHYGVNEPRNIRGISTPEEEKTLKDEGIQFFKLPMPPPPDAEN